MFEYKEIFLDKIKVLLYYFVEFSKDESILFKDNPKNCAVCTLNKRPIIMIIHNKKNFLVNNGREKVWIQDSHTIFQLKDGEKNIMLSDFLLTWS